MNEAIANLTPEAVWRHFAAISAIPRCSKQETAVRNYVIGVARTNDLSYRTDDVGNVVIQRPAGSDAGRTETVVLQGHLDMVCEKNMATTHDFESDPIQLIRDGDWLTADNTTLGADNGIAVAIMLAILELDDASLGPVECLFTVDEETGLTGAVGLDPSLISGRTLINLDTEEEGFFCIGCAGGKNTSVSLPLVWEERSAPPDGTTLLELRITGLRGGHSGAEIHLERGNSNVLGGRLLAAIREVMPTVRIADIAGGDKHNAIPREFRAVVAVPAGTGETLDRICRDLTGVFRDELGAEDPDVKVAAATAVETDAPVRLLGIADSGRIIDLLRAIPHGVLGMSREVPGLVETSTNLASVGVSEGALRILTSQRSSRGSMIDAAAEHVAAPMRLAGGEITFDDGYPAWPPRPQSDLVDTAVAVYTKRFGTAPEVGAFHAGLECGVIGDKVGGMDMISFGPDMQGVHTPDEKISISSTERTWEVLLDLLRALAQE
ncbi:MAG: aminoacyl-histidine dipeptidase [Spirochaeta sp.]|jgi:dipeptidase D|nr:aminoacyl-histidine dipeptidase [Spirochaeta sp.]